MRPATTFSFIQLSNSRASLKQMGVAGDDAWGARTHEEYLLDAGDLMEFEFSFRGIGE